MNIELLRNYCISKKGVTETFPFDSDTLVFKVAGKMFALTSLSNPVSVNLKGEPEQNIIWRQEYEAVKPGWHMSKLHWNTVMFNEDVNDKELLAMVETSYILVVQSLPKKVQATLL
jgi:predicted DNA-binding protein (MmcQ/YjbR family)